MMLWSVAELAASVAAAQQDDVAVVHYSTPLVYEYPDGRITGQDELLKFTHTWMRVNGQWQIIGGMCGALKPTDR